MKIFLEGVDSGGEAGGEVRVAWSRGRCLETDKLARGETVGAPSLSGAPPCVLSPHTHLQGKPSPPDHGLSQVRILETPGPRTSLNPGAEPCGALTV